MLSRTIRTLRHTNFLKNASSLTRTSLVRMPVRRSIQTNFPPPTKPKRGKYILYATIGLLAVGFGYWKYLTYHNYPPEVADKMRLALYAEGTAGGSDYKRALVHYLEALEEADKVGLYYLSDEYTGLQLKVAEMYEKLNMKKEAYMMYREIGTAYITALSEKDAIPIDLRPHIIQRDLRVALKTAYLESATNPEFAKIGLMVHFMMAQTEVAQKSPELAQLIEGSKEQRKFNIPLSLEGEPKEHLVEAWKPFRDELFSARDMFVALCIATGDIGLAIQTKLTSTEWMAVSGFDASETLMSFYNAGAIFYLQAEELEVRHSKKEPTVSNDGKAASAKDLADISLKNAIACFSMVITLIKKLPARLRRESDIDDVQALATYGLGVISLHKGDLEKADDLLREARLRAKGCGYLDLVQNSEMELEKLRVMKDAKEKGEEVEIEPSKLIQSNEQLKDLEKTSETH